MADKTYANIDITLSWKSSSATHTDVFHVLRVDAWNDILPVDLGDEIAKLKVGESYSKTLLAKDFLGEEFTTDKVISFDAKYFDRNFKNQNSPPILNRFYPTAIAWQGLDADDNDYSPFRLISADNNKLVADSNHPLAKYYLTLTATKTRQLDVLIQEGRPVKNIIEKITMRGPGMQVPFDFSDTVFFAKYPFQKKNTKNDGDDSGNSDRESLEDVSYTQHLDSIASKEIARLYSELLPKHSKILDLMCSAESHLAADYQTGMLTGLGFMEEELAANTRLDTYQIQNVNEDNKLPFEADSFDDAICTISIEYLTDPIAIFQEVARVVKSNGKFIITFSDRFLTTESISLWAELHPFERMQLVLEYYRKTNLFEELNTFSKRGLLRRRDDKYFNQKRMSDPVYAVWGTVK